MVFNFRTPSFFYDSPVAQDTQVLTKFSFKELKAATQNFRHKNLLGIGSSGKVFKGRLRDGSLVAVKRLHGTRGVRKEIFEREMEVKGLKIYHPNILSLRGYCRTKGEYLLVYPLMINNNLRSHLRGYRGSEFQPLSWAARKQIALGVARGLAYLHHCCDPKIIHGDIKPSTILLDQEFEAVIGGFGIAKIMHQKDIIHGTIEGSLFINSDTEDDVFNYSDTEDGDNNQPTLSTEARRECIPYVLAPIRGTLGFLAPESLFTKKWSLKSDVHAFGITLLCFVTGQSSPFLAPSDVCGEFIILDDWVRGLMPDKLEKLMDPDLQGNYVNQEAKQLVELALQCAHKDPRQRPEMLEVVRVIEDLEEAPQFPISNSWPLVTLSRSTFDDEENFVEGNSKIHLGKLKHFSFQALQVATNNFIKENVVGEGRFGSVYKGQLVDGSLVAVKRLELYTRERELQFQCEVLAMHKINTHQNMLPLLGFCMEKSERLLVYPYMVNGSLASALGRHPEFYPSITFHMRKQIAVGVAKVLAFMHEDADPRIIHRDFKSANVLLDDKFQPLLGHYGWAKFIDQEDIHVSSVGGTVGYIAPEYPWTGQATTKRDVFAFGVTLLEILTGQRAFDFERVGLDEGFMLYKCVRKLVKEGMMENIIDPNLGGEYDKDEVEWYFHVALLCTNDSPEERPKMSTVVKLLETPRKVTLELDFPVSNPQPLAALSRSESDSTLYYSFSSSPMSEVAY